MIRLGELMSPQGIGKKIKNRVNYLLNMNYKVQISKYIFYKIALKNDRKKGVDFYQSQTLAELGHPLDGELIHYGATRTYEIMKVLKLAGATANDAIFDFGCGKGLGLVNFHRFGFKMICGVELNSHLCEIARKNLSKLKVEGVSILNRDATSLGEELDPFNYFYFYNPFTGSVFRAVLDNLIMSLRRKPRQITIIYNYPIERDVISKCGYFQLFYKYTPFFFGGEYLIFKSRF
jgi:hypothetical protein